MIQTLDNAAKYKAWGLNGNLRTKMFKKIDLNLNSGFSYSHFEDNSPKALIKSTNGITFIGNLSLNTRIIKDKVALSLNISQNGPNYGLLSKRVTKPYISFSANTSLIKDKLSAKLFAGNLLGKPSNGFDDISQSETFYQKVTTRNNSTNVGIGITYFFGKKFNDNFQDNAIENEDIRR